MTLAFLFVECMAKDDRRTENVRRLVKQVHGVLEAYPTIPEDSSIYDMVVKVQADDEHKLNNIVHAIKGVSGVAAVDTNIACVVR